MLKQWAKRIPLLEEEWEKYKHYFRQINIKKNSILLREGETASKIFFIEKGCLRMIFEKDGKDITYQFFMEHQAVASVESFLTGKPSLFSIESIEPSLITVLQKKHYDLLLKTFPEIKEMMNELLFQRLGNYTRLFLSFIKDTPEERYIDLVKTNPGLIQRIPQHYIASYLGISPVSLSRIRNRIQQKCSSKTAD